MTNIMKHAQATQVAIRLTTNDDVVCLTITDNGCGFDPTPPTVTPQQASWGLLTMRERAEAVGARFTIQSQIAQSQSEESQSEESPTAHGTTIKIEVTR